MPSDVLDFCKDRGIRDLLDQAIALARTSLPVVGQPTAEMSRDPDTGEEWISLAVVVKGKPDDVLSASKRYTAEWVARVPWPERFLIRLSFDLA